MKTQIGFYKFAMQLAIILNQDKTGVKWGEAVRREEVDRSDVLDCLDSIHDHLLFPQSMFQKYAPL